MAVGNTFGATALSSFGGFWISYAIVLTPGFAVLANYQEAEVASVLGFFLTGWFIFTFILLLLTLRSTVMFFLLFFTLDLAFLFLATAEYAGSNGNTTASVGLQKAGGVFGLLAAFLAWYNAFAGIADTGYDRIQPLVLLMTTANMIVIATRSSSSPSSTSRGLRRPARPVSRRTARWPKRRGGCEPRRILLAKS